MGQSKKIGSIFVPEKIRFCSVKVYKDFLYSFCKYMESVECESSASYRKVQNVWRIVSRERGRA